MKWVRAVGSPHLLLANDLLPYWNGASPKDEKDHAFAGEGPIRDYYAEAHLEVDVGLLPVGAGVGLVFALDPPASTWVSVPRFAGGAVVQHTDWNSEPPDLNKAALAALLEDIASRVAFESTGIVFPVSSRKLTLMTASDSFTHRFNPYMEFELAPAHYEIVHGQAMLGGCEMRVYGLAHAHS